MMYTNAWQVIYVNETLNLEEAEGARLTEDLIVGKQLAGGAQVIHLRPYYEFFVFALSNNVTLARDIPAITILHWVTARLL